jgi:DUF4097 and DUF4098 domain-containing protein YvlB
VKKNVFLKVFFSSVIWTALCMGLAAYAANKAVQQDPDIVEKVVSRVESTSNVHVTVGGAHRRDFVPAEDSWTFATPTDEIDLIAVNGDVEVIPAKAGTSLIVTAKGRRHKNLTKLLVTTATQKTVSLEQPNDDTTRDLKIRVQLPADFKGRLSIKTVSGDMDMNELAVNDLNLQSVSGDVQIKNSEAKNIRQSTVSGDIDIENKVVADLDLESVSGDFTLRLPKSTKAKFNVRTLSGEITNAFASEDKAEKVVKISSTSGDIKIY